MKPRLSLNEYQQKHTEIEGLIGNGNFCAKSSANGNAALVQRVKASIAAPDTMLNRVVFPGGPTWQWHASIISDFFIPVCVPNITSSE